MYIFRLYFVSSKLIDPLLKGKSIEIGEEEGEGGGGKYVDDKFSYDG